MTGETGGWWGWKCGSSAAHSQRSSSAAGTSRGQQSRACERTRGQEDCVSCLLHHLQRALLWRQLWVHLQVPLQRGGGLHTEREKKQGRSGQRAMIYYTC